MDKKIDQTVKYLGFIPNTKQEIAVQVFINKFGVVPEIIIQTAGALNLGPIPQEQDGK